MTEEAKGLQSGSDLPHSSYLSYLVRMWFMPGEAKEPEQASRGAWRGSVESPMSRQQRHFTDLESLFEYLRMMTKPGKSDDTGDVENPTEINSRTGERRLSKSATQGTETELPHKSPLE